MSNRNQGVILAFCFFNKDKDDKYRCEYSIEDDEISVSVEYDIFNEIPCENGVRIIGNQNYNQRDILIVDSDNNKYYLLKNAYYAGNSNRYALLEVRSITIFKSKIFFSRSDLEKMILLPETPKCTSIRIFSRDFHRMMGIQSYQKRVSEEDLIITLKKKNRPLDFEISTSKIKRILFDEHWFVNENSKEGEITINVSSFLEIQLKRKHNYDEIYKYINELAVYMQLFTKNGFKIDKVMIKVDDVFYDFNCMVRQFAYKGSKRFAVEDKLKSFLKICYSKIDYACTTKVWLRNIPYVIVASYGNIEDNYLLYFKFIECFFKAKNEKGVSNSFIVLSIKNHYRENAFTDEQILKISREIVCLRNHYVHAGYYIKNNTIRISKPQGDDSFEPYTVKVDFEWLFERTRILRKVTIDIIYKEILGYSQYCY